jgi:uroporphyrinogen III methyltransferase / synthase
MQQETPLKGWKVLVTRPKDQAAGFSAMLRQLGAEAIELPLITIAPPFSWDELDRCFEVIDKYDWIIFASANAVRYFMQRKEMVAADADLSTIKIGCVGPATVKQLTKAGLTVDFQPSSFIADAFVAEFPNARKLAGVKILWPRTNIGRNLIADQLSAAGAQVDTALCYQTLGPANPEQAGQMLRELLYEHRLTSVTFTSAQTVRNFRDLLGREDIETLLAGVCIAVIGKETAQAAKQHLNKVDVEAPTSTVEGLIAALTQYAKRS